MSETKNVIIAIIIVNILAVAGILYEINYFEDGDVDTSTLVTASLIIKFDNLDENETMTFDYVTTSESTVYGILLAASNEGQYTVTTSQQNNGLIVESIADWGNCGDCQKEDDYLWNYKLNDLPGSAAANRKIINNGDIIQWTYSK